MDTYRNLGELVFHKRDCFFMLICALRNPAKFHETVRAKTTNLGVRGSNPFGRANQFATISSVSPPRKRVGAK